MKYISVATFVFSILIILSSCKKPEKLSLDKDEIKTEITCTNSQCEGFYEGPEFINNDDIAHQFSNKMSAKVGEKLKELYQTKNYSKVDFEKIEMSTVGMGSGNVIYVLKIPFEKVESKCEAFTSFDHVGGWNHEPALEERKIQLKSTLMQGDSLNISILKTTPENLQEYWIQWRNKDLQQDCS
ncbi:hypothetical protein [Frigoriflavimonas asaccharolytica]|uniref:Lipoprotein n=1 Tax=Frigoriflavimonas asaccharolytica TaxID=2735899 RepID=A0A8J8K910_9FLAO|nr:hypothetical protein [Frigoriflavimonas asaccharolytica]NRS93423.1 hypothetical protein [Frigoriflavimonas asaccharolytica]